MLDEIIKAFLPQLLEAATLGRAGYLIEYNLVDPKPQGALVDFKGETCPIPSIAAKGILTDDDLVQGCKNKFPGCQVSFKGNWIPVGTSQTSVFKMGIYVSWA